MSPPTALAPVVASPPRGGDWLVALAQLPHSGARLGCAVPPPHFTLGQARRKRGKRRPLPLTTTLRSILLGPCSTAKVIASVRAAFVLWSGSSSYARDRFWAVQRSPGGSAASRARQPETAPQTGSAGGGRHPACSDWVYWTFYQYS